MGVRVFNKKTNVSVTCDAKFWADCSDHGKSSGFVLWSPEMTVANSIPALDGFDDLDDLSSVSVADYGFDDDALVDNCSDCGDKKEIYDTDNYVCLDCFEKNSDGESNDSWFDEQSLNSSGWRNDEYYD